LLRCSTRLTTSIFQTLRLDVGIDGENNTIQQLDAIADPIDEFNAFENAFHIESNRSPNRVYNPWPHLQPKTGRTCELINPSVKECRRFSRWLQVFPRDNASRWHRPTHGGANARGLSTIMVWSLHIALEEKYAAWHLFPIKAVAAMALIKWTAADRSIANTRRSLWYTFGHTHIPRPRITQ